MLGAILGAKRARELPVHVDGFSWLRINAPAIGLQLWLDPGARY